MKNRRLGLIIIGSLICLAALLALIGPKFVKRTAEKLPSITDKRPYLGVTAKGVVETADNVELSSQIKGLVSRMLVEEGVEVKKGQLLLEFDQSKIEAQRSQARAALAAAEARYRQANNGFRIEDVSIVQGGKERAKVVHDQAKDEYQRQQRLFEKGAATQMDLNHAEEKLKVAASDLSVSATNLEKHVKGIRNEERDQTEAEVDRARADLLFVDSLLKDYRIYSPISGIVTERHKVKGEGVDIGTPLLKIINPETLRIRAELEETEVGKVKEGQQVEVTVDAFRNKVFQGKVSKVFSVVQRKELKSFDPTATFDINTQKIHIILTEYAGLRSNMTVTVRFK
ncbi:MAG: HlyD family efflux transporter periplasmic adaptor subunit [Desulfuromonadales bacterium]